MKIYRVGGAIRDTLLGMPYTETDFCVVGAKPADMISAGYKQVGKDFPVFLHPQTGEEYALARTERKSGVGYHGFDYEIGGVTLEEDLLRRDLTINAMAMDEDKLIDPYGGLADLKDRKLKHVSEAFAEDPLRVLRVARFAARFHALGFTIAPETLELMRKLIKELSSLTPERVLLETQKALETAHPAVYFDVLNEVGAELFPGIKLAAFKQKLICLPMDSDLRCAVLNLGASLPVSNRVKTYQKFLCADLKNLAQMIERDKLVQDTALSHMFQLALIANGQAVLAHMWPRLMLDCAQIDFGQITEPPGPAYGAAKQKLLSSVLKQYTY